MLSVETDSLCDCFVGGVKSNDHIRRSLSDCDRNWQSHQQQRGPMIDPKGNEWQKAGVECTLSLVFINAVKGSYALCCSQIVRLGIKMAFLSLSSIQPSLRADRGS